MNKSFSWEFESFYSGINFILSISLHILVGGWIPICDEMVVAIDNAPPLVEDRPKRGKSPPRDNSNRFLVANLLKGDLISLKEAAAKSCNNNNKILNK